MKLSTAQIEIVRSIIDQSRIQIQTLKDDLLDHLCCVVEIKMDSGKAFDQALMEAQLEIAPGGLDEIQRETLFLFNSIKIMRIKKIMYLIGLLSAMAFVSGWTFSLLHLPGGKELSIYGFLSFAFVFLPLLAIDYFKVKIQRAISEKFRFVLGLSSGFMVALSVLFKTLHYEGAPELLIAGSTLFILGFLPFLFFNMYKKSVS